MSQRSFLNIDPRSLYLDITIPTHFGIRRDCLDMHAMEYRIFGAVWKLVHDKKYILGYWFADQESEILSSINNAGFTNPIESQKSEINEIYQSIRIEQDRDNWSKRSRLPFFFILKKPWKDLREGWYILKSSKDYPMILTCIQKKQYAIWIEHIQVCEHKSDVVKFINLINTKHNIHLSHAEFVELEKRKHYKKKKTIIKGKFNV